MYIYYITLSKDTIFEVYQVELVDSLVLNIRYLEPHPLAPQPHSLRPVEGTSTQGEIRKGRTEGSPQGDLEVQDAHLNGQGLI